MAAGVPVLLITANVGSIFEEPSVMLKVWTEEFLSTISRLDPKFIALHCQEVGGKNYGQSMSHVQDFVRLLMSSEELRLFDKVRVFLDEDYSTAEHFTALGNFYFVHNSIKDVLLWDFKECIFVPVNGKEVHSGNIEAVTTKEKAKFPQDFFPECKWSRKGFLRTRWNISGTVFDLINIHLFHDASNFIAMETFPSVYSKTRRRALEHTLDRFHNDQYPNAPYFLFGDFNFRTDTAAVIKKLTEDTHESKLSSKGSISKLQFRNKEDDLILTLGKKEFSHYEHQNVFIKNSGQWLREYDKELEDFDGRLFEFPIKFVPSYPFEEDIKEGTNYMQTRVPAWCDRVLLSPSAKTLVQNISSLNAVEYGIIGPTTCMGDHKPVYLRVLLASDAGMINCCNMSNAPELCFRVPSSYMELLSMLPDCNSCVSARVLSVDNSSNFLHATPVKHDPYTPDSMESPSPNMSTAIGETSDVDIENVANGTMENTSASAPNHHRQTIRNSKRADRAVSPALLKSRLELIAQNKKTEGTQSNSEQDVSDMRRSPSENHLPKLSDSEWNNVGCRRIRSNSDASWLRSQRTWDQDKLLTSHSSVTDFLQSSTSIDCGTEGNDTFLTNRIIPRIAIINASSFESDASSHLHDDRHSCCSEHRLRVYPEGPTKTINGDGLNHMRSEEVCDKIDEESEKQSTNTDERSEENATKIDSGTSVNDGTCGKPSTVSKKGARKNNAADTNCDTCDHGPTSEIEVLRSDSRQEILASKKTTRSNSIQSQDICENAGTVKLKVKAYNKVTERYKQNIAIKKGRCRKCCCAVC